MTRKVTKSETDVIGFWEWLRCACCLEVKAGVGLLIISLLLLFSHQPLAGSPRWWIGTILYWVAITCLVAGLLRDIWVLIRTRYLRTNQNQDKKNHAV
jgi:hypothetical protein